MSRISELMDSLHMIPEEHRQALTDEINAYIAEVIGEDETHWTDHFDIEHNVPTDRMNAQNQLRAEQRKRAGLTDV